MGSDYLFSLSRERHRKATVTCIQTAIENGLDPYKYLTWLLKTANTADLTQAEEIQKLLPWNASAGCRIK